MKTARALAVQHETDAPPGLLGEWAQRNAIAVEVVRPDRGERLPERADDFAFVAVLGAAASVTDAGVPWLADELRWLASCSALGASILGICFGAQALAAALGGTVRRAARPELGWVEFELCAAEPGWAGVLSGPWFTWHEDAIQPPASAAVLAHNESGVQAYSLGRHLAVQFHPEVTPAITARWIEQARSDFPAATVDAAALRRQTAGESASAARRAFELFDAFAATLPAAAGL